MTRAVFVSARTSAAAARHALTAHLVRELSRTEQPRLYWIPLHSVSGACLARGVEWLEELVVARTDREHAGDGELPEGEVLSAPEGSAAEYWPFWVSRESGGDGHAAVLATTGRLVLSRFTEDRARSYADLVAVFVLAAFGLLCAAFILDQLTKVIAMAGGQNLVAVLFMAGLGLLVLYLPVRMLYRYYSGVVAPALAAAAVRYLSHQIVKRPPELAPFFRTISGFAIVVCAWSSLVVFRRGEVSAGITVVIALVLAVALFVTLRRQWKGTEDIGSGAEPSLRETSLVSELASLIALSLPAWFIAMLITNLYQGTGVNFLSVLMGGTAIPANELEDRLIRFALVIATMLSGLRMDRRVGLSVSLGLPLLLPGEALRPIVGALTVVIVAVASMLLRPKDLPKAPRREAIERGLGTAFFGHLGRLLGQLSGGLMLGTAGLTFGAIMGEQLGMAMLLAQPEAESTRPTGDASTPGLSPEG